MSRGEVLVAIINKPFDFTILHTQHWYRIPVSSVERWLKNCWPPQWLAFYQTKVFESEKYAINYYARVTDIRFAERWQLFPDEPRDHRSQCRYYRLWLSPLQRLPQPIISRRMRRIVFIPTTWSKFNCAIEINDLYDDSPLEDFLWSELKRWRITAERQEYVILKEGSYVPDFTIRCVKGKIIIETDGDTWHANPEKAHEDNLRDNAFKADGWRVLRFNTTQIREQTEAYCIPTIVRLINNLGGLDEGGLITRKIDLTAPPGTYQVSLFDNL